MKSEFLSLSMTSCGVCGEVIFGTRSLKKGTIRQSGRQVGDAQKWLDTTTGKRTEHEGQICWVHYPGICWIKAQKDKEVKSDGQKAAANDSDSHEERSGS